MKKTIMLLIGALSISCGAPQEKPKSIVSVYIPSPAEAADKECYELLVSRRFELAAHIVQKKPHLRETYAAIRYYLDGLEQPLSASNRYQAAFTANKAILRRVKTILQHYDIGVLPTNDEIITLQKLMLSQSFRALERNHCRTTAKL